MLKLIKLEWKSFFRSASFKINIVLKIILGLGMLFYGALFLMLGVAAFYLIEEEGLEPLETINAYLIYWWGIDLVVRFFAQKPVVMGVRPLLLQPISKRKITHYLLGKSATSFYNFYPALFFIPFSITLIVNDYSIIGTIGWYFAIFGLTYFNNYLNLALNNKIPLLIGTAVVVLGIGGLHIFNLIDVSVFSSMMFDNFFKYPWMALIILGLAIALYRYNFNYFFRAMYLDDAVKVSQKNIQVRDYSWLGRFGLMGAFLKNDIRLIFRNKRSMNTIWMSLFFLFYGLIFFTNPAYEDSLFFKVFASVFISGGFLFIFGGFVPSWDSSYYPFMMSQSITYKDYLASKWWLMVVATFISIILASFYLFLGVEYYLIIVATGIYNIGVNTHITLLSGAFVKTPIDLESGKKPFGDKGSFNMKTLLLTIPKIILPALIFSTFTFLISEKAGYISLIVTGLIGLLLRNAMFKQIESVYKTEKYETIQAYKQKN